MYNENHAIIAWFKKSYAGKQKTNKKIMGNDVVPKAPSGRELDFAKQKTEGECVIIKFMLTVSCAGSFRHTAKVHLISNDCLAVCHLPLGGRLLLQPVYG